MPKDTELTRLLSRAVRSNRIKRTPSAVAILHTKIAKAASKRVKPTAQVLRLTAKEARSLVRLYALYDNWKLAYIEQGMTQRHGRRMAARWKQLARKRGRNAEVSLVLKATTALLLLYVLLGVLCYFA